jgi:hypothetical protein
VLWSVHRRPFQLGGSILTDGIASYPRRASDILPMILATSPCSHCARCRSPPFLSSARSSASGVAFLSRASDL